MSAIHLGTGEVNPLSAVNCSELVRVRPDADMRRAQRCRAVRCLLLFDLPLPQPVLVLQSECE